MPDNLPPSPTPSPTPSAAASEQDTAPGVEGSAALEVSFNDVLKALVDGYGASGTAAGKEKFAELLSKRLRQVASQHDCTALYNIIVMFDNTTMVKGDSDSIYKAVNELQHPGRPLMLILLSNGGEPGSAYLIGQLCRESSNGRFAVTVPRHAKSAATLLACAADEIHMGSLSELGPIDPQINNMPALGLKNSIEHIASLVSASPNSAEMFARYLYLSVEPIQIGYYERVAQSAVQYAERLLQSHPKNLAATPGEIAEKLVYGYKDHGFVIDKAEATSIFGADVIKTQSVEYALGNAIYMELSEVESIADLLGYRLYLIGTMDTKPGLIKKARR